MSKKKLSKVSKKRDDELKDLYFYRHFNQHELIIAAFRYYLGRMTISTVFFARALAKSWLELEKGIQSIIARELEMAFQEDDEARVKKAAGEKTYSLPLGWDCDREAWEEVRVAAKKAKGII